MLNKTRRNLDSSGLSIFSGINDNGGTLDEVDPLLDLPEVAGSSTEATVLTTGSAAKFAGALRTSARRPRDVQRQPWVHHWERYVGLTIGRAVRGRGPRDARASRSERQRRWPSRQKKT